MDFATFYVLFAPVPFPFIKPMIWGAFGGHFRAIGAIKYVVFEETKILDVKSDIFIVFRERQKRYKNAGNPWGLLSGV